MARINRKKKLRNQKIKQKSKTEKTPSNDDFEELIIGDKEKKTLEYVFGILFISSIAFGLMYGIGLIKVLLNF